MSDEELTSTPPELRELADNAVNDLVLSKSKNEYQKEYEKFESWRIENKVQTLTENVLLAYFEILSKTYKSSTLWKTYSMLRLMINIRQNVDISKFMKLQAFLKRLSVGFVPKKSKILEYNDIEKFISAAPDMDYLVIKASS
ncbi:hypothetical protein PPYR_13573 [Photinus pyralis]|uniref:Uncharacterized protein n=1 Tax=Photinus pyralis TaxID=7054 RepID=A0A5N4A091_PHOPY|nr:hypothetical protein PPYR_14837 [Photinus pyralis]KAB0793953.1 hypothetical protein PPYR_13573 [Photinus pyralis]